MKFACPSCKTRYSIADEKLPVGASVKFKCKNCGTTIRLKRKAETAPKPQKLDDLENSAASTRVAAPNELQKLKQKTTAAPRAAQPSVSGADATAVVSMAELNELRNQAAAAAAPPPEDDWYVLISGNQKGPMPVSQLRAMVNRQEVDRRNFVWKAGMNDWLRLADVEELSGLLTPPPVSTEAPTNSFSESTAMMDASALHEALAQAREGGVSAGFDEQTQMMSAAELHAQMAQASDGAFVPKEAAQPAGQVSGDTFTESTAMMDVSTLQAQLAKAGAAPAPEPVLQEDTAATLTAEAPTRQTPFETGPVDPIGPIGAAFPEEPSGNSDYDDQVTGQGFAADAGFQEKTSESAAPKPFHKAKTEVARLEDIAAMTGFEEDTAASRAPTEGAFSSEGGADPFASLDGPGGGFNLEKFDTHGLQDSYDHDAPPGEQTRVFMATAGIYKRRRQNMISAIVGTILVAGFATIIALDFMGVYTIPGMGLAYELTGFEDPNEGRVLERKISRETDPLKKEELERRRRQMLGLADPAAGGKRRDGKKTAPSETAEEGIVENGEMSEDQKKLADSLFNDARKSLEKISLQQPGQVTAQVDLPDGLTAETIQKVIAEKQSAMKLCLAEASRSNESLRGRMEVQLTIAPTGKVTEASITSAKFKSSTMGACTVKRVQSWKFPRFNGTPVTVAFPYVLTEGF